MRVGILPVVGTPPRAIPIDNNRKFPHSYNDIPNLKVAMSEF